jgi:probable rRNA maturation factor
VKRARGDSPAVDVTITVSGAPARRTVHAWVARLLSVGGVELQAVSVLLCGDARMRRLNRIHRGKDAPTDVLSFPSVVAGFLGDVVVDVPLAARQARVLGHGTARELQVLLAHGLLHLRGYDHETDDGQMFAQQSREVLRAFGPGPDGVPPGEPAENA